MRVKKNIVSASVTTVTGTYKDLGDFGFTVESWTDALSGPARSFAPAEVPGRTDTTKLSTTPTIKPGQIVITGTVAGDTMSAYLTNLRNLKGWLVRTVAIKVLALDANVFLEVDQTEAPVIHFGIPGLTPATRVSITFQALKPYWQSTTLEANAIGTSFSEQALGTAPVRPVITVTGNPSAITFTYANSGGTTVQLLTLSGLTTSGATQTVIDCANSTIVSTISGTPTDVIAKLDTSTDFFALDPADADTVTPVWPKLKYSATGTVTAVSCSFRKSYW